MSLNIKLLKQSMNAGILPSFHEIKSGGDNVPFPMLSDYVYREQYTKHFSWSLITRELVEEMIPLLKGKKVVDVGCGLGWLTHNLLKMEPTLNITTIDDTTYENGHHPVDVVMNYENYDYTGVEAAIISWPSYESTEINVALKALPKGCIILYCGEGYGGCTGSDETHDILDGFEHLQDLNYNLQFSGLHDRWSVYQK